MKDDEKMIRIGMWSLGLVGRGGELVFNLGSYKALYMDGGDGCVTRKNRTLQSFVHVTELCAC